MLKGSCLCGAVTYEAEAGDTTHFYHCHCRRCRKATGTGHASNLILVKPLNGAFTAGEELLTRYKVPDAKRFAVTFCSRCGSRVPSFAADGSVAVVPAGSLDTDPGMRPQARIFQGSKADWSCDERAVPGFDTYPE
jgi:hypothetical protein